MNDNVFNILAELSRNSKGSKKVIAKFFLDYDDDYNSLTVQEVAKQTYTSAPTIVRFTKSIGYSRFAEFRVDLIRDSTDFRGESDGLNNNSYVKHLDSVINSFEKTEKLNSRHDIIKLTQYIKNADVINLYAMGETGIVAHDFQLKLIRIGFYASFYEDKHTQYFSAVSSTKNTLAVGISYSGNTKEVLDNLKESHIQGATTYLITKKAQNNYDFVDNILCVYANESVARVFSTTSRFALLFLMDLVYHELISQNKEEYNRKLDETRLIKKGK